MLFFLIKCIIYGFLNLYFRFFSSDFVAYHDFQNLPFHLYVGTNGVLVATIFNEFKVSNSA